MVSVWEVNFGCVLMVCRRCCRRQPHDGKTFDRESRAQFRPGVFFCGHHVESLSAAFVSCLVSKQAVEFTSRYNVSANYTFSSFASTLVYAE